MQVLTAESRERLAIPNVYVSTPVCETAVPRSPSWVTVTLAHTLLLGP